jgi:hypothetical protein
MIISASLRRQVIERAGNCCEYSASLRRVKRRLSNEERTGGIG